MKRIILFLLTICFFITMCPQAFSQTKAQKWAYMQEELQQARNGNVNAQMQVAKAYKLGIGVQKNMEKAAYWWQQAAMNGDYNGIKGILYEKYKYFRMKKDSIYADCQFWKEQLAYTGSSVEMESLAEGYSPLNLVYGWDKNYDYSLLSFFDYCFDKAIFWANLDLEKNGESNTRNDLIRWLQSDNEKCQKQLSMLDPSIRNSIGLGDSVLVQKCMIDLFYTLKYNMWEGKEYRFTDPFGSFLGETDLSLEELIEAYDKKYRSGTKLDFRTLSDLKIEKKKETDGYSYSVRAKSVRDSDKQEYMIRIEITPEKKINSFALMKIIDS